MSQLLEKDLDKLAHAEVWAGYLMQSYSKEHMLDLREEDKALDDFIHKKVMEYIRCKRKKEKKS